MEAGLQAKARIIETFLLEASAENILSIPGNPIAKQLEKDQKALKDLLKREEEFAVQAQKEAADILKSVDSARADELEGVTVGDRLNRLLEAAIRKIDESYTEGSIAEDKKQRVEDLKLRILELFAIAALDPLLVVFYLRLSNPLYRIHRFF